MQVFFPYMHVSFAGVFFIYVGEFFYTLHICAKVTRSTSSIVSTQGTWLCSRSLFHMCGSLFHICRSFLLELFSYKWAFSFILYSLHMHMMTRCTLVFFSCQVRTCLSCGFLFIICRSLFHVCRSFFHMCRSLFLVSFSHMWVFFLTLFSIRWQDVL